MTKGWLSREVKKRDEAQRGYLTLVYEVSTCLKCSSYMEFTYFVHLHYLLALVEGDDNLVREEVGEAAAWVLVTVTRVWGYLGTYGLKTEVRIMKIFVRPSMDGEALAGKDFFGTSCRDRSSK
jgi:hypothetical protein